jgi:riboflavin-specific deaminase-like protein
VRQLFPAPLDDVDLFATYGTGPAVRLGMVTSLDGAATDEEGWTNRLGGEADRTVFRTLRALADGIMVGAGTIRTGRQGPHRLGPEYAARRRAHTGHEGPAPLVVVSRTMRLDWTLPVFTAARVPTIVLTTAAGATDKAGAAPPPDLDVTVLAVGDTEVDLPTGIELLRARFGLSHLLCEGGPTLATALLDAGLVDELCLTLAPTLLGDASAHRLVPGLPKRVELTLRQICEHDGTLLLRYGVA